MSSAGNALSAQCRLGAFLIEDKNKRIDRMRFFAYPNREDRKNLPEPKILCFKMMNYK